MTQTQTLTWPTTRLGRVPTAARVRTNHLPDLMVLVAMALRFAPAPFNVSSFVLLALVAASGPRGVIIAFAGTWFVGGANPGFAEETPLGNAARYIVFASAIFGAAFRSLRSEARAKIGLQTAFLAILGVGLIVHSFIFSLFPSISLLKAVLWVAVSLTLLSSASRLDEGARNKLHLFFLAFFAAVLLLSLLSWPLPESRLLNGTGLQGLINHPQVFGVFCAIAGAYYFGAAVSVERPPWLLLLGTLLCLVGVIASESRTGGMALIGACAAIVAIAALKSAGEFRASLPGLTSGRMAFLGVLAAIAMLYNANVFQTVAGGFIDKRSGVTGVGQAFEVSRGDLLADMRENISERPIQGIGLGVASDVHLMVAELDQVTGLAVSAPVEKGVMWIAIFEELGMVLGGIFLIWVVWGVHRATIGGAAVGAASIAYFLTNFGEATFFSPGAFGLFGLVFFFLGCHAGHQAPIPVAASGRPGSRGNFPGGTQR